MAPAGTRGALLARVFRGRHVESIHTGHIVVVDASLKIVLQVGNPQTATYLRSAAKPFQALPLLGDHIDEAFGLSPREMALICASHNGEAFHVEAAASILKKCGLAPEQLLCGIHRPLGVDLGVVQESASYHVLQNNCSGKHAGMLAACQLHGWPVATYIEPTHPHQKRILATLSEWSGLAESQIGVEVDGCSVPVFYLPLVNIAQMYANLATQAAEIERVYALMWQNAEMVAGTFRFDTELMRTLKGKVVTKTGAEGLQCLAVRHPRPLGIAIKISDGNKRAIPPIVLKLLWHLGVVTEQELRALQRFVLPEIRNHRKILVGRIDCPVSF